MKIKYGVVLAATVALQVLCSPRDAHAFQSIIRAPTGPSSRRNENALSKTTTSSPGRGFSDRRADNGRGGGRVVVVGVRSTTELSALSSPLGAVSILAGIVLIHEAGHYLAARSFNITVEEFSVGIGPKLFGFRALGNEFNLRALPLGGYVRFPENYNSTLVQEQERAILEQQREERDRAGESGNKDEKKFGPALLSALTFGALKDKRDEPSRQLQMQSSSSDDNASPWWKKLVGGNGNNNGRNKPLPKDVNDLEIEYYDDPDLLYNRPWQQRAVVLSAGVIFNILLSFTIFFGQIHLGSGVQRPVFDSGIVVSSITRSDAAARGVLREGDVIVGVDGVPATRSSSPSAFESQRAINQFVSKIRSTSDGDSLQLSVLRANDKGKNRSPDDVTITPRRSGSNGPQTIGVLLTPNYVKSEKLRSDSVPEAAAMAAEYTAALTKDTTDGLASFIGDALTVNNKGSSGGGGSQVSGPIGLIRSGSEVVSTNDVNAVLFFAAAISINLGVVNAFPLPALDGGQLVFVAYEAVTGRRVNQRVQENITGATLFLLLLLSFGAAVGDIESIIGR